MDQPTLGTSNLDSSSQPTSFGLPLGLGKPRQPVDTIGLQNVHAEVRTAKIMIVDDEDLVIRVVRRFLATDGYENFVTLTDPREAIDVINREKPDVVLLDIMMPHITGLDLLKIRQKTEVFQHIPFIILTANSENQIKRDALKYGATDFLSKPVDPSDLVFGVQNALTVKRHHDHLANYAIQLEQEVRERTDADREVTRTDYSLFGPSCRIS